MGILGQEPLPPSDISNPRPRPTGAAPKLLGILFSSQSRIHTPGARMPCISALSPFSSPLTPLSLFTHLLFSLFFLCSPRLPKIGRQLKVCGLLLSMSLTEPPPAHLDTPAPLVLITQLSVSPMLPPQHPLNPTSLCSPLPHSLLKALPWETSPI